MLPVTKIYRAAILFSCCAALYCCTQKNRATTTNIIPDTISAAAKNPYVVYDQSPMDMSYFPVDFPLQKMNKADTGELVVRLMYSRPHKKNRSIFGNTEKSLCQYGKEWRLGANEATEIEFFKNVSIEGHNLPKGSYVLYCIPFPDKWTIVFNSNLHTWGLHMDSSKDIFRVDIPVMDQSPAIEDFTMVFQPAAYGANLVMAWDNTKAELPIGFAK
ncbi:MAG: hypothetical protein JWQ27_1452 [Ferruginibacter sp.]|nr:hypothetical protein [Ferruginibacter sp.]